jgi:AMP deaminase
MAENPFQKFFRRGMNVTLSTDDPLLFHMSDDALLEEYSVARATFDLSMTDMMELARNSIFQSGFEEEFKEKYLGKEYRKGATFCDEVRNSNLIAILIYLPTVTHVRDHHVLAHHPRSTHSG